MTKIYLNRKKQETSPLETKLMTLLTAEIIKVAKMCAHWTQWISHKMYNRHPLQLQKIKIQGAVLELPAKQHCRFGQFGPGLR